MADQGEPARVVAGVDVRMVAGRLRHGGDRVDAGQPPPEVLDTDPSVVPPADPVRKVITPGALEFDDVGFNYPGAEHAVLSGVSFATAPGQTTAVVGSTGPGKTTLVNLILRLFDSNEGQVTVGAVHVNAPAR